MDRNEAIQLLKTLAPKGATIISTVKGRFDTNPFDDEEENGSVDVGGRVISFCAVFTREKKVEIRNIDGAGAIALGLQRYEVKGTGEGIYIGGTGMDFAYAFVSELGNLVWKDSEAYTHYAM